MSFSPVQGSGFMLSHLKVIRKRSRGYYILLSEESASGKMVDFDIAINGGCSLYVPVRSSFKAACIHNAGDLKGDCMYPRLFWALKSHE